MLRIADIQARRKVFLGGICRSVNKGIIRGDTTISNEVKEEASFCCCIACAVAPDGCNCSQCSDFRRLHESDLELLTIIVADINADAERAMQMSKNKKERDVYLRVLLNEGISGYSERGRVKASYRVGTNAGERMYVCRKRFSEAYGVSTRTIDRMLVEVRARYMRGEGIFLILQLSNVLIFLDKRLQRGPYYITAATNGYNAHR